MLSREGSLRGLLYTPGFKAASYGALSGIAAGILPGEQVAPAIVQQCFFYRNLMIVTVGDPSTIGGRIELPISYILTGINRASVNHG